MEKLKSQVERLWYAQKTVEHGWSRNILVYQIEGQLYQRLGGREFRRQARGAGVPSAPVPKEQSSQPDPGLLIKRVRS